MRCKQLVVTVLCLLCCVFVGLAHAQGRDLTLEPNTAGADVVRATVAKVLSASRNEQRIFGNRINYWLLRRIAYVETRDGLDTSDQNYHGGIWRVDEEVFNNVRTNSAIQSYRDAVETVFDIRWNNTSWTELRKPLYSALATALNLVAEKDDNCLSSITREQALCWLMRHRRISDPGVVIQAAIESYKAAVAALDSGCTVNADISFLLDSSGSIRSYNYRKVKEFAYNFTEGFDIGPKQNRVSMTIYGNTGQVLFGFDQYENKTSVLEAIENIPFLDEYTNTPDGLCKVLNDILPNARLSDSAVFKLVVVMTDGQSNRNSSECGDIRQAAGSFRNFSQVNSILVYVIGVTNNVNREELELMATAPEFITHLDSFVSDAELDSTQQLQTYELCFTTSGSKVVGGASNGSLDRGGTVRLNFDLPVEGITIRLCVSQGYLVLYASVSSTTPNSAVNDFMLEIDTGCTDIYIDRLGTRNGNDNSNPDNITLGRRKRQVFNSTASESANLTLYISIEGVEERNTFILQTTTGDTTIPDQPPTNNVTVAADPPMNNVTVAVIIGCGVGGGVVLLLVVVSTIAWLTWAIKKAVKDPVV